MRASHTPAPRPATKFLPIVSLPSLSLSFSLKLALRPNRIPALGILPSSVGARPRYSDRKPVIMFLFHEKKSAEKSCQQLLLKEKNGQDMKSQ